jgi:4-phytase / acid phosphatase
MRLLLAGLLIPVALAQSQPDDKPKLTYVVVLSRHGVRSPTAANDALIQYAADPWPNWGVAPGELTEHGRKLLGILGGWYRGWLAEDGLLPESGCGAAGSVHVRADVGQRTTESARALAEGMFPGCGVETHTVEGDADPLFHPVAAGLVHGDAGLASAAVSGRIGGHPEALGATLQHAFGVLREVLFGCPPDAPCPAEKQPGKLGLLGLPASVAGTEDGLADIRGPLRTGSTMAENLLLEYADGKTGKDLGWGRLDEARLDEVMAIHTRYADIARRTEYLARLQGSNLLSHILRSLEQAASGKAISGALGKPGDRLLLLGGHDTNISHLAGLLNISWLLPGYQRDDTPPGGALVFRLWRGAGGHYAVETLYIAQTLQQMRDAAPLGRNSPPASARIFVPGCPAPSVRYDCGWEAFRQIGFKGVNSAYVGAR